MWPRRSGDQGTPGSRYGSAQMSDTDIRDLFPDGRARVSDRYDVPDPAAVVRSMRSNRHFTLLQAWAGLSGVAGHCPQRPRMIRSTAHLFGEYAVRNDLVATLHHEPGGRCFVDWAGDTVAIADAVTGEAVKAPVRGGCTVSLGMVFCQVHHDGDGLWIAGHVGRSPRSAAPRNWWCRTTP